MDPDWIWVGHVLADGFGPFGPFGNVIGGLWNGPKRPNYGLNGVGLAIIGPFWAVLEPPNDIYRWPKWPKPISQDVSHPDPVWIHLDPPVLGLQGRLWPKYPN